METPNGTRESTFRMDVGLSPKAFRKNLYSFVLHYVIINAARPIFTHELAREAEVSESEIRDVLETLELTGIIFKSGLDQYFVPANVINKLLPMRGRVFSREFAYKSIKNYQLEIAQMQGILAHTKYTNLQFIEANRGVVYFNLFVDLSRIYSSPFFQHQSIVVLSAPKDAVVNSENNNESYFVTVSTDSGEISTKLLQRQNTCVTTYLTHNPTAFGDSSLEEARKATNPPVPPNPELSQPVDFSHDGSIMDLFS